MSMCYFKHRDWW